MSPGGGLLPGRPRTLGGRSTPIDRAVHGATDVSRESPGTRSLSDNMSESQLGQRRPDSGLGLGERITIWVAEDTRRVRS